MGTGFHFEEGVPLFTVAGADIPVILAVMAAAIAAEIFLATRRDGRLGLLLPGLRLLQTLARLSVRIVQVARITREAGSAWLAEPGQALVLAFAVENIPTLLLLITCVLCRAREGRRTRRQLERTRIEDL